MESGKYSKGSVLLIVLIVLSCMTTIVLGFAYQSRIEIRLANSSSQQAKARQLALAGLEYCKALLAQGEQGPEHTVSVCRVYPPSETGKLVEQLKLDGNKNSEMTCWISDENGYLDLNKSDPAVWEKLPGFGRDKRACVADWKDTDSDVSPSGAERDQYEQQEMPYSCKNGPFMCLRELLFVKGVTRNDYCNYALDGDLTGTKDIEKIISDESSLVNQFTVHGQETVNINTASANLLAILPGFDRQAADRIAAFRAGPDGKEHTSDDVVIKDSAGLAGIEGLTEIQAELLGQYCNFDSNVFRAFCYAVVNNDRCLLMATIAVSDDKPKILAVERLR